jgi:hypothetical protein
MQSKRLSSRKWLIGIIAVSVAMVLTLAFHKGRDVVVRTAKAADGKSAAIVGYRHGSFEDYAADLVLYAPDGKVVLRTNLIPGGRDSLEDIPHELLSMEIRSNAVHLEAVGNHYRGTNEFRFPK